MVVIFVRRLIQAVLVLLLVALISFAIFRFVGSKAFLVRKPRSKTGMS